MTTFEILTLLVAVLLGFGGWIFAWRQSQENQRIRERDRLLDARGKKADRVFDQLDTFADLEDLYRLLANMRSWIVRDENNEMVMNSDGIPKVERRVFEIDPDLEKALSTIEETDNIKGAIANQVVRLHSRQSRSTDLLHDLDPTGQVAKAFGLLYHETVTALGKALESGEFWNLHRALENAGSHRKVIRAYVNYLANNSNFEDAGLPELPSIERSSIKHVGED